jgi:GxxExxY protein
VEYEEITRKVIGAAYAVYKQLGFGFLESVYKKAMLIEFAKSGLKAEEEKPLQVHYTRRHNYLRIKTNYALTGVEWDCARAQLFETLCI